MPAPACAAGQGGRADLGRRRRGRLRRRGGSRGRRSLPLHPASTKLAATAIKTPRTRARVRVGGVPCLDRSDVRGRGAEHLHGRRHDRHRDGRAASVPGAAGSRCGRHRPDARAPAPSRGARARQRRDRPERAARRDLRPARPQRRRQVHPRPPAHRPAAPRRAAGSTCSATTSSATPSGRPRLLAYLGQESTALDELTVALAAETTGRLRGLPAPAAARRRADAVLEELGLTPIAGRPLDEALRRPAPARRFAAALVGERPLLVLDEPTTGMDPVARRAVWAAVDRRRAEPAPPCCSSPTTSSRPRPCSTGSPSSTTAGSSPATPPAGSRRWSTDEVRLDLVWRDEPPLRRPDGRRAARARRRVAGAAGRCGCPQDEAREAVAAVTGGPAFAALDDFTLATPSLEDVYLALGGATDDDLERVVTAAHRPARRAPAGPGWRRGPAAARARAVYRRSSPGPGSRGSRCCSWRPSSRSASWS